MAQQYTVQDYATDQVLWEEHIDPDNNVPFDSLTKEQREQEIRETFPEIPEKN